MPNKVNDPISGGIIFTETEGEHNEIKEAEKRNKHISSNRESKVLVKKLNKEVESLRGRISKLENRLNIIESSINLDN